MPYIELRKAADNTLVSGPGVFTNSVDFTLRADLEETDQIRLYLQAETGYNVTAAEVIPSGSTAAKWALAPDDGGSPGTFGAWGAKIELGAVGPGAGDRKFFWARARATSDESPVNDTSVTLAVTGIAAAV